MDEPVHIGEWDPAWHVAAVAEECRAALGEEMPAVKHIGSTAVRSVAAEPVIDMLIGVPLGWPWGRCRPAPRDARVDAPRRSRRAGLYSAVGVKRGRLGARGQVEAGR